ncbi:Uncharacterised protein [Yersinia frederiksenii]|nr:Uncharacterised protein [Yersinia frederiksenii]CNI79137.1 Uncharacterised protein [Yersinia enterocolitica]
MKKHVVPIILVVVTIMGFLYVNHVSEKIAQWVSKLFSVIFSASP